MPRNGGNPHRKQVWEPYGITPRGLVLFRSCACDPYGRQGESGDHSGSIPDPARVAQGKDEIRWYDGITGTNLPVVAK